LADEVRPKDSTLAALKVSGNKREWLASFIDLIGECWEKHGEQMMSILNGLLPDQNGRLTSPDELKLDPGVPDELKDICGAMALDVRAWLLDSELRAFGTSLGLKYLDRTLIDAIVEEATEEDIVDQCLDYLDEKLPEDEKYESSKEVYLRASIRLMDYLSRSQGKAAELLARKLPFVTRDGSIVRWSITRMLMAPVCSWQQSAQSFWTAYPPDRVVIDAYAGLPEGVSPKLTPWLAAWGIVYASPITTDTPKALDGPRLAAIAEDKSQSEGVTVSGCQFSQIALLQPELINRCGASLQEAKALLGMVLCHVAPNDPSWKESRTVVGKRGGKEVVLKVCGALWLADLSFRAWVPVEDPEKKLNRMHASRATLENLLYPTWLQHNDSAIALLSKRFGFDELELRLLGTIPDEQKRRELRNGLARLVESAGSDPEVYVQLAQEIEARHARERDIARCRKLGLAIQEAVRLAMEARNLELTLVDKGFDFEVIPETEEFFGTRAFRIEVGPYLLEIKATTTGEARMTPTQAKTARAEISRYVLCVVDLRQVSEERLDEEWTPQEVEQKAVLVTDIGQDVAVTCENVDKARASNVAIRNDGALRYEVPVELWQRGISIREWVEKISQGEIRT
jgi:hypothetical protein